MLHLAIIYVLYFMGKGCIWTLVVGSEMPLSFYTVGLSVLVRILKLAT